MDLLLFINLIIKEIYNGILVIIDKYTKYVFFIPFKKDYLIIKFAYIFFG